MVTKLNNRNIHISLAVKDYNTHTKYVQKNLRKLPNNLEKQG